MRGVVPVLFVVTVEAARQAVGRIADITADRHMEGVRLSRWVLSPIPTFRLWRRMKLWELRSYDQAITLEQDRLIYEARLEVRYGPSWRRTAPIEALMPLRLAKFGVPVQAGDPAHLQPSSALELPPATAKSGRLAETPPLLPSNATPEDAPTPPAETDAAGRLGPGGQGIALHALAAWVPIDSGELQHLVDQLTAADWLVDAALTDAQLTGQLTERVLPLPCPLRA